MFNRQHMEEKITFSLWTRVLIFLVLLVPLVQGYGQTKVSATEQTNGLREAGQFIIGTLEYRDKTTSTIASVENGPAVVDGNSNTYSKLTSKSATLVGIGSTGESWINMKFPTNLTANTTSFVKIDKPINTGLQVNLIGLVGGLTGLFESNMIIVEASLNGNKIDSNNVKVNLVESKDGGMYVAVSSIESYNSITIRLRSATPALGIQLGAGLEMKVYEAFYYTGDASCGRPLVTGVEAVGLNVNLLGGLFDTVGTGQYGKSIDTDENSSSVLKAGNILNVNVGSYVSQYFYFTNKSKENATFNIKLGRGAGILDLSLLSGLEIRAYEGNKVVYVRGLRGGLLNGINILQLLQNNPVANLTFAPGKAFDKVEIRLNTGVNVGLATGGLDIYDVQRYDNTVCINPNFTVPTPTQVPFETASCATTLKEFSNVDFATDAVDNNNETYATLYAKASQIIVGEATSGMIHLAYPQEVSANTTSYIRIDMEEEVISKLVGGTLGTLLEGAAGLLLGSHHFDVEVYNNTSLTPILKGNSNVGFRTTDGKMTIVQDKIGRYYLAVTPDQPYKSIKITNSISGVLAADAIRTLKVYNMCREIGTDPCFAPQFTSFTQTGISASITNFSQAGVKNPYYAISGNSSEYAEINNGLLAVGATVRQLIYFNKPSQSGDQLKVRLQANSPSLLSLELLGGYKIVTFLGNTQRESFTLQQGLINNLNLLNLFKSGGIQTFTYATTLPFDRVEVQVQSVVGVNLATPTIRLYDVKRVGATCPETSTVSPFTAPVCATQLLGASNANDINNLFDDNFDSYATLQSGSGILLGIGEEEGFVELGYTATVPAHTTSYVRIDFEGSLLKQLVGGSLGNLVTGLLDGLLLGNHYFKVTVKDASGNPILEKGSQALTSSYSDGKIRVVMDKLGRTYLAITPTQAYKSVRITDVSKSIIGATAAPNTMNVYGMCYETSTEACVAPFVTSYEYEGISLDVTDLSNGGVTYPERAIDDNSTHGSQMSLGTINVGGSVKQWFYFNSLSEVDDVANIRLKTGTGAITVPLLEKLEIKAYKGDTFVDQLDWNNGLIEGTEIAGLLSSASLVDIPFKPNGQYDRISIGLKSLANVGVLSALEIYKVERLCSPFGSNQNLVSWKSYKVNGSASTNTVSGGEKIEYTIHVKNVGATTINNFTVSDRLPIGTSFYSVLQGRLSEDGQSVLYDFSGTMTPGNEQRFVFTVDVNPTLEGILQIKNTAFTKEAGSIISYPSYPPVDNTNPITPDLTKNPGTIIGVVHSTALPKAIITSDQANAVCPDTEFTLDSNKGPAEADAYQWYVDGEAIDATMAGSTNPNYGKEKTLTTNYPGSYTVIYTKGAEVSVESDPFVVTQSPAPVIEFSSSQRINVTIPRDQNAVTVTLPTATVVGGNGTIKWYNHNAVEFAGTSIEFTTPGVYTLTVVATSANGCESYENVMITVYDDSLCPPTIERVYATGSSSWGSIITGGVSGTDNTIDGDPTTYSTLTTGIGLLGIGTVWQNVYFEEEVAAGTPVTIKLGKQYSGLMLAGGISVVGLDADGNTIGTLKSVQGGLLDLLAADNVVEFTFVPSDKNGPKQYKGVRISQGSLLSVAQLAKVYHVYYTKNVSAFSPAYCEPVSDNVHPAVLDVLHGVQDLGLGVASATASVSNPWNAVDGNLNTYATIARGVAVLNAASLTVVFKQQAMPGDKLHIITEVPGNPILSLELIKGYTIQRYLGDQKVGEEIDGTDGVQILDLKLLGLGYSNKYKMIIKEIDQPFDRVKISYGSVVGVLGNFTKIFEVTVAPRIDVGIDIEEEYLDVCQGGILTINAEDNCSTYEVYTEETGGTPVPTEGLNNFKLPYHLPEYQDELPEGAGFGPKYSVVYVQTYRNGCVIGRRLPIRIILKNCSVKSNLNVTQKIK